MSITLTIELGQAIDLQLDVKGVTAPAKVLAPDGITVIATIPAGGSHTLPRAYNKAALTGQAVSRRTGDDVWHRVNGTYTYNTVGIRPIMDPTDWLKLAPIAGNENAFGNFERFTADDGTAGWAAKKYKIDHYTGYAVYWDFQNGLDTWNNQIDWAEALVHNVFDDWRLANAHEAMTWVDIETDRWLRTLVDLISQQTYATSSSESSSTHYGIGNHTKHLIGTSGNMMGWAIRDHYK